MEIIIIAAEHMGIITCKWVNLLERLVEVPFGKVIFLTGFSRGGKCLTTDMIPGESCW